MDTFLVRVWVPADDAPAQAGLRGFVRHVATGAETPFRTAEELVEELGRGPGREQPGRNGRSSRRDGEAGTGARPDEDRGGGPCSHR